MKTSEVINKTMDFEDLKIDEAQITIEELNHLIKELREKGLKISSWFGTFN